ncbi:MAG: aroK [Candidatus Kaiserbacteria bacterium]|nr:aroK [Candidatus Kaiserbacteria bacterium]
MAISSNICLVGYGGVGKTTVGRLLAERTGHGFVDMDARIELEQKCTIVEIFDDPLRGENFFRECERGVLRDIFFDPRKLVISTGGGTFPNADNREMILSGATSVWLDVPLEVIFERLKGDTTRPLLRDREKATELYKIRRPLYGKADVRVDASRDPEQVVESILSALWWLENS